MKKLAALCAWLALAASSHGQAPLLKTENIRVRDPFIYADAKTATYYLYAQAANRKGSGFEGVEVYISKNLSESGLLAGPWTGHTPLTSTRK